MESPLEEAKQDSLPDSLDLEPQPPSFKGKFDIASYAFSPKPFLKTSPASQGYKDFNQNSLSSSSPDNILNLANEQLLKPTYQQRTSKLKNYFLGCKEYLETPPSPTPSDQDQLFSRLEHSSTKLDEVPPISPSHKVLLQNLPKAEFQVNPSKTNKSLTSHQSPLKSHTSPHSPINSTPVPRPPPKRRSSSTLTPSPSPKKKPRTPTGYAPPSTYAHLPSLRDVLAPNLICLFIGLNPGLQTAIQGHAYAHHSNLFWKLLHSSGCTSRRCAPSEDGDLPRLFGLGNTNIVSRPTRNSSELSHGEMDESVSVLEEKVRKFKPEAVCIVGKSIWESIWRVRHGGGKKIRKEEFRYGWQDEERNMGREVRGWEGAKVFVACSTSGLAATLLPAEKERIWRELGVWVEKRREERSSNKVEKPS